VLLSVLMIVITFIGTLWCYWVNRAGDNREFIDRYICYGFPLSIRFLALFLPIAVVVNIAAAAVTGLATGAPPTRNAFVEWINTVLIYFLMVTYYWRFAVGFRKMAGTETKDLAGGVNG